MYSSSNIGRDGCTAEQLSSFPPDPLPSNPDMSDPSMTSYKNVENITTLLKNHSSEAGSSQRLAPRGTGYLSTSCNGHLDWNLNGGHQAKRARVENIIKGMTNPPGIHSTDMMTAQPDELYDMQEKKRIEELPPQQERSPSQRTKPQDPQQLIPMLSSVDEATAVKGKYPTWSCSPDTSPSDAFTGSYSESDGSPSRKYQGWKKVKLMNYFQSKPERIKLMADVLKHELSRAVNRSVDSVFKSMPLLQTSHNVEKNLQLHSPLQPSFYKDSEVALGCCGNADVQVPDVQTEALALVVQKPPQEQSGKFLLQSRSRALHHPEPPVPFTYGSPLDEEEASQKTLSTSGRHGLECLQEKCSEVGTETLERFDMQWNSIKVRSKVNSRSVRSPQTRTVSVDPVLFRSLCLPHVKIESENLVKNSLYMLNEGLTTNHLKKAKLMFFYTRYPSSLVLRTCFYDVQFTRCITSQLIKWFSNFREFYYIQMEKFARHALVEAVADVRALTVGRESELFRILNMHYNKANDFQVPDRFLEVAEITLREFYIAISVGKDRDPSWKKAIYKVICKLDSDVPAEFKKHRSG
ncbi:uncharacterized protein V6R79_003719 [Siganus canaliculatus]